MSSESKILLLSNKLRKLGFDQQADEIECNFLILKKTTSQLDYLSDNLIKKEAQRFRSQETIRDTGNFLMRLVPRDPPYTEDEITHWLHQKDLLPPGQMPPAPVYRPPGTPPSHSPSPTSPAPHGPLAPHGPPGRPHTPPDPHGPSDGSPDAEPVREPINSKKSAERFMELNESGRLTTEQVNSRMNSLTERELEFIEQARPTLRGSINRHFRKHRGKYIFGGAAGAAALITYLTFFTSFASDANEVFEKATSVWSGNPENDYISTAKRRIDAAAKVSADTTEEKLLAFKKDLESSRTSIGGLDVLNKHTEGGKLKSRMLSIIAGAIANIDGRINPTSGGGSLSVDEEDGDTFPTTPTNN